ncbi:hypothetical protein V2J09_010698 [Rumex salicifolius]
MKMKLLKSPLSFFILCVAFCASTSLLFDGVEASHKYHPKLASAKPASVNQALRTGYHFQPPQNWINGPLYYKGFYHLFYQYNPKGAIWGNIVWAHSVSKDLINWEALEPAIWPSKPFDINGTWSGSATILPGNKPVILYTGLDKDRNQQQNIAFPADLNDPYLRKWIKPDYNPVIKATGNINSSSFRDPTTAWWSNGNWHILVGGKHNLRGKAYLYKSRDFKEWTKAKHPLHSKNGTGNWECPDFFPVALKGEHGVETSVNGPGVKHVLKVSLDLTRYDYYTIGTYDTAKDIYVPDPTSVDGWDGLRYDYGNFYASKVFFDNSKNRRILLGWANESDTTADDVAKGWAGIHVIPRKIWLAPNGRQLIQWPVEELLTLRTNHVELPKQVLKTGRYVEVKGITAPQADVEVVFTLPTSLEKAEPFNPKWTKAQELCAIRGSTVQGGVGPFGLLTLASRRLEEYTPVFFRVFKAEHKYVVLMCSDATSSSLDKDNYRPSFAGFVDVDLKDRKLSLRSLIDNSVVESFGAGGKTVITSRVYPTIARMEKAHLYVFNNGTEPVTIENLTAWSMKRPMMNN